MVTVNARSNLAPKISNQSKFRIAKRSMMRNWDLYLLLLLPIAYFLVFKYRPMGGLIIAFKNYKFNLGYLDSPWAANFGMANFIRFFKNAYFGEIMLNTLGLSVLQLVCSFPVPILLAIIMNEIRIKYLKKSLQLITYAPHFISTVILVAIMEAMLNPNTGVFNAIINSLGGDSIYFFGKPNYFRPMYILSGIWQNSGYSSIIYLAALSNIDPQLVESARIDGANRLQIIRHITFPAIIPTAVILLIMDSGRIMSVGFEKVYLMQNDMNVRASEVISTFVYKSGIEGAQFSFSTAVGLFNAVINITLLLIVNKISKKLTETSLW